MKKLSLFFGCIIALVAFAAWAPNVEAFVDAGEGGCLDCHSLNYGGNSHTLHTSSVTNDCNSAIRAVGVVSL